MIHQMKLQPNQFSFMKDGTKRIEIRLNDTKRKRIKIGDTIKFFKEPDLEESFETKVIELNHYKDFEKLFANYDIDILADKSITKEDLLKELEKFYSKEKQKEYGVLGIKIEKV